MSDRLPEVFEEYWERDRVSALFADLDQSATVIRAQVRTGQVNSRWGDSTVSLQQAQDALDDANTRAVQIYYQYDGRTWCDTLLVLGDQIRIVRTIIPDDR